MSLPPARTRGFTLIEVIAALVVFAIGVLFTTSLTTSLATQMRHSAIRSHVVSEAQQHMDSMLVLPFASLTPGETVDTVQIQGVTYLRTVDVEAEPDLPRVRTIRIEFTPEEQGGPAFILSSSVARP